MFDSCFNNNIKYKYIVLFVPSHFNNCLFIKIYRVRHAAKRERVRENERDLYLLLNTEKDFCSSLPIRLLQHKYLELENL